MLKNITWEEVCKRLGVWTLKNMTAQEIATEVGLGLTVQEANELKKQEVEDTEV